MMRGYCHAVRMTVPYPGRVTSTPRGLHETIITDRLASQLARDRASHQLSITDEALSGADVDDVWCSNSGR